MSELITRKWLGGKLVSETKKQVEWGLNEADLDVVEISCECGHIITMPRDALFALPNMHCGSCGHRMTAAKLTGET